MALDESDIKKVTELVTAALAAERAEAAKATEAVVGKAIKALDIDGKITALDIEGKIKAAIPVVEPPEKEGKKGKDGEPDSEVKRMASQLAELQKKLEIEAKKATDAEAKRQDELLNNGVRDALLAAGADSARVAIALSHLRTTGVVKLKDGAPGFAFRRDWGEDHKPGKDGAAEWLATDEGKFFLPPTNQQGTGDGAGKKTGAE